MRPAWHTPPRNWCAATHYFGLEVCVGRFRPAHSRRSFVQQKHLRARTGIDEISFTSGRDRCAAWHFGAKGDAFAGPRGVPCVVMGPGFAPTASRPAAHPITNRSHQ